MKWLKEGIIEKVTVEEENLWGHYLLHRHVLKENSTTRLIPVFDASAKSKNGLSLNQCLETGPNLIELISSILLRFREKEIGVISDIEKAFLQINITPKDRNVLRFLWWNKNNIIEIYCHRRVRIAQEDQFIHMSDTIKKLFSSFYVDNCVTSVDSVEELYQFKEESKILMTEGGFNLRGWEYTHCEEPHQLTSVLGLTWDKREDVLMLKCSKFSEIMKEKITKRIILTISHKIFDPIGFACPVLLYPKLLLQTINTLEWDTEVPQEVEHEFRKWYYQLHLLKEVKIPRWISNSYRADNNISFHVFVDASQVAYASVIYMRTQSLTDTKIQLIAAKSRVTPNKKMTIPRLELLAATIVLTWIQRESQWPTFVWNRVQEIRKITNVGCWRYVPGVLNPADLPSRGCTTKQLIESKWWEGPDWLYNSEKWPTSEYYINNEEINSKLKKSASKKSEESINLNSFCQNNDVREDNSSNKNNDEWHLRYFSRYTKLVRMLGWIRRFIHNAQVNVKLRKRGELSAREFCEAEKTVLRFVQEESFSGNQDSRIKDFRVYTDRDNLIRIKTLITQRDDDINFREPVVLNPKHPVVMSLISHYHEKLHVGVQTVLNEIREKFWILQGRKSVWMIVNKCIICKRYKASHVNAELVALPKNGVGNGVQFEISGVDFAGPVYLKVKIPKRLGLND
ncbi:hypothetical protein ILUMI_21758 [Ignelater luminosus]|uniref:Integrase zinc-binding domain-containing protein n=1 Tax=Ignelater luminosus TaxID=2038154 RepID=A0A8K0CH35_IGNLU|nr:hypothetical protein ILUMI_21758 [Ignelater luminosus]